jgi:hypothetical protein
MNPHLSAPCACRATRIPYATGAVVIADETHRASNCTPPRIELKPAFIPPAPRLLSFVCEHGESRWAMGPEPEVLVKQLGCQCPKAVAS